MKKVAKIAAYIICVFLFQEMIVRFCFPIPELSNFDRTTYMSINPNSTDSGFMRNVQRTWVSIPDTDAVFTHDMNLYGFRDAEWAVAKEAGKKRALFIGDSFVEGVMAAQDQTIPEGFKNAAGASEYEVLNGGMCGTAMISYLQLAADAIPIFKPDVAFLCLYSNDLGQTWPDIPTVNLTEEYFDWYMPRAVEVLSQSSMNRNIRFRWQNATIPYLMPIPDAGNPWSTQLERYEPHVKAEYAELMKEGKFNPFRVNAFYDEEIYFKQQPKTLDAIFYFVSLCQKNGVEPVVVYIPSRNQVTKHYYQYERNFCTELCPDNMDLTTRAYQTHQRFITKQCRSNEVQFINLAPTIKAEEERGNHLFWNYDEHMRGKGYLLLGQTIWEEWNSASN